ncbi:MAG: ABC transporter ATP-binding protein [Desulfobacter sp.]
MDLELRHIGKQYKRRTILEDISFGVGPRELVSVVGPSGAGKTTLLKIIAGLEQPDTGQVVFSSPPTRENPVIIVFQDYVLFPSMTVRANIGFGLRARKMDRDLIRKKTDQMLEYFQLAAQADQYPAQLSAGQKQRVAIARAMVVNPAVLLLDEPFANLDRNLKMETARFIRNTQKEFGIPTVSVTHDLAEAFAMSDRIGILLNQRMEQFDTPEQVYFSPASRAAAEFLGPVNRIPAALARQLGPDTGAAGENPDQELAVRPENIKITPGSGPGRITEKTFAGHYFAYTVELDTLKLMVYCQDGRFKTGQTVSLKLGPGVV